MLNGNVMFPLFFVSLSLVLFFCSINVCWTSESDVSTSSTLGEYKLMIDSPDDKSVKSSRSSDYSSFPEVSSLFA